MLMEYCVCCGPRKEIHYPMDEDGEDCNLNEAILNYRDEPNRCCCGTVMVPKVNLFRFKREETSLAC